MTIRNEFGCQEKQRIVLRMSRTLRTAQAHMQDSEREKKEFTCFKNDPNMLSKWGLGGSWSAWGGSWSAWVANLATSWLQDDSRIDFRKI